MGTHRPGPDLAASPQCARLALPGHRGVVDVPDRAQRIRRLRGHDRPARLASRGRGRGGQYGDVDAGRHRPLDHHAGVLPERVAPGTLVAVAGSRGRHRHAAAPGHSALLPRGVRRLLAGSGPAARASATGAGGLCCGPSVSPRWPCQRSPSGWALSCAWCAPSRPNASNSPGSSVSPDRSWLPPTSTSPNPPWRSASTRCRWWSRSVCCAIGCSASRRSCAAESSTER